MKKCFKCHAELPLSEFYKHPMMADGRLGKCKLCTRKDTRDRTSELLKDPSWVEKEQERHRNKYHRLGYKEKHKPTSEQKAKIMNTYKAKYPEKNAARCAVRGIKAKGYHRHHWSYNDEHFKDVVLLNEKDHAKAHRYLVYDQSYKKYRTKEGALLETKEQHIEYITQFLIK